MKHRLPDCVLIVLALLAAPALAQDKSSEEIVLRAQTAHINQQSGTGVYRGEAEMTQGLRHLTADTIYIQLEDEKIRRVEATGNPVHLTEESVINARAKRLVYDLKDGKIYLFEDAFVDHQGRTFEGAQVRYDVQSREIDASGNEEERVRLVIPGKQAGQDGNNNAGTGASTP